MPSQSSRSVALSLRPKPDDYRFDLREAFDSIVKVTASVPRDAVTAEIFGAMRVGSGTCIIEPGLIVTAAMLVADAAVVALETSRGRALAAVVVGCDHASGLAVLRAARPDAVAPLRIGDPGREPVGAHVIVAAAGGLEQALAGRIANRQSFAAHWEYVLEEGIVTTPAHPHCVGAALIGTSGALIGVTAIEFLRARPHGPKLQLDLTIPIDLLPPILDDLVGTGRSRAAPRPWLGLYLIEVDGRAVVADVAPRGPADAAGIRKGDALTAVAGAPLQGDPGQTVEALFRSVWGLGVAGIEVPLTVERDGRTFVARVQSRDRGEPLRPLRLH